MQVSKALRVSLFAICAAGCAASDSYARLGDHDARETDRARLEALIVHSNAPELFEPSIDAAPTPSARNRPSGLSCFLWDAGQEVTVEPSAVAGWPRGDAVACTYTFPNHAKVRIQATRAYGRLPSDWLERRVTEMAAEQPPLVARDPDVDLSPLRAEWAKAGLRPVDAWFQSNEQKRQALRIISVVLVDGWLIELQADAEGPEAARLGFHSEVLWQNTVAAALRAKGSAVS